jgi:hypothetical protein
MLALLKSSIVWQFAGGFLLGAAGLVVLHPGEAGADPTPVAQHQVR